MHPFAPRLQLDRIEEAARIIDPVFLHTPQYVCEALGDVLGMQVVLKVETLNPVRSFKGRGADVLVAGVPPGTHLICASAGNLGQALAYACRTRQVSLTVYASMQANPLKVARMQALGAQVILHGDDFDDAKLEAARAAQAGDARLVVDSLDLETLEGAGTIGLELLDLPEPLDALLIALGNGALFNGIARVMKAARPQTQMIAVQAAGAPAMVNSWRSGHILTSDHADTIADGIAVRIPMPEALADMQGLADDTLLVGEPDILHAMRLLHQHAGIVAEPSAAVGVAALLQFPQRFHGKRVGTVVCGGNLTPTQMHSWLLSPATEVNA